MGSFNTKIYTSELILCFTIFGHGATRHNIPMYPYFLFAAIHHLNRPRLSLSDLVPQSTELTFIYLPQNTNKNETKQNSNTKANKSGEEAQKKPWGL